MKFPVLYLLSLCICCFPAIGQSFHAADFRSTSTLPPSAWEWLRDTASSSLDTGILFNNRPALRLSGFYPSARISGKVNARRGEMRVSGCIRIDSLDGEVDIAVRLWDNPARRKTQHIAEFHHVLSSVSSRMWQEFRLEVPLCRQADVFDCEVSIKGTGKIWIGGMNVLFPSTEEVMTSIPPRLTNIRHSGVFLADPELSPAQVENLIVLGKVWGFLKYFHPAVREGCMDWDRELFRMIPIVLDAGPDQRNSTLAEWCRNLGNIRTSEKDRGSQAQPLVPVSVSGSVYSNP